MKKHLILYFVTITLGLIFLLSACDKEQDDPVLPQVTTAEVIDITDNSAFAGGSVANSGTLAVTQRGVCCNTEENPTLADTKLASGNGEGDFSVTIENLLPETEYFVRAYATCEMDTVFGSTKSFTTLPVPLPVVSISDTEDITETSAIINAEVVNENDDFEIREHGICPKINSEYLSFNDLKKPAGQGTGEFTVTLDNLSPESEYEYRAYAITQNDTFYSNFISFTTLAKAYSEIEFNPEVAYGEITDVEGNTYQTVEIGTQVWMAQNLNTTQYNDGSAIPLITGESEWESTTTGAYCNYNNDEATGSMYGKLYNGYTVETGKLCPVGWHVPESDEWETLIAFLGGEMVAGGKLKEQGTTHWSESGDDITNESGFTALPGGIRTYNGAYNAINIGGYWRAASASETQEGFMVTFWAGSWNAGFNIGEDPKNAGLSVRCIKD
ncbi:MAG: fibrobacter succinogenes major paralogous domain-containing protein [Prolixibacteraceae bacterium]|nr:fibrobacter succinogenes major paralogous domain-containing protein [Prolixibacteraceae bacterium]